MENKKQQVCELCGGDGFIEEYGDGDNFEYDVIAEHPCPNGCISEEYLRNARDYLLKNDPLVKEAKRIGKKLKKDFDKKMDDYDEQKFYEATK